jgi:hypothetical protein
MCVLTVLNLCRGSIPVTVESICSSVLCKIDFLHKGMMEKKINGCVAFTGGLLPEVSERSAAVASSWNCHSCTVEYLSATAVFVVEGIQYN